MRQWRPCRPGLSAVRAKVLDDPDATGRTTSATPGRRRPLSGGRRPRPLRVAAGIESGGRTRGRRAPVGHRADANTSTITWAPGPALLGHAHPAMTAAVAAQLPKGTTYYFLNEPEIALAQKLVEAIPCADVVHYVGSGNRSDVLRAADRAGAHRPQQDPEVRRRVARHARLRIVGHRSDRAFRLSAREGRFGRRAAAGRRNRAGRAIQRNRSRRSR